ncbi:36906_t:CDS:2, partial [Racocetra persica]
KCQLCQAIFPSRKELIAYERIKHRINKTIPHRKLLNQPLLEQVVFYQDALIVFIKKCFGFNRYSIGTKQVSINAFPENIFGEDGELQSKQLVNYDYLNVLQDPKLKTISYVLFKDHDSSYVVNFSWSRSEFKENNCTFQYDTTTCKFITDLGKFSE